MTSALRIAALVGALFSAWGSAQASLTTIAGVRLGEPSNLYAPPSGAAKAAHDAFLSSGFVNVAGTESFTGAALGIPGTPTPGGPIASIACAYPAVPAEFFDGGPACEVRSGNVEGRFDTTSGTGNYLASLALDAALDGLAVGPIRMNFADPNGISAFGFYGTDIGDFGGSFSIILTDINGVDSDPLLIVQGAGGATQSPPDGTLLFWGFYDSAKSYKAITFVNSKASDVFGIDDIIVGKFVPRDPPPNPTPEPGMLALLGIAGVAASMARRRRDRRAD